MNEGVGPDDPPGCNFKDLMGIMGCDLVPGWDGLWGERSK